MDLKDVKWRAKRGKGVSEEWAWSLVSEVWSFFVIMGGLPVSFVSN